MSQPPAPAPPPCRLLAAEEESGVLARVRFLVARATLRSMFATARLRVGLVVLLSAVFWGSLYVLFHEAFTFVEGLHAEVVPLLFNAFFSSLMAMILFSTAILMYGSLYTAPATRLLLTLPVRSSSIFTHTFLESFWFSSWGFILLGSPMLVAYGVVRGAPWTYYLLMLPLMVSFVAIPALLGGIVTMALVAWMPRLRLHALGLALAACVAGIVWLGWRALVAPRAETFSADWLEQALSRLAVTEHRLLPSWWLSTAIVDAASRARDGALAGHLSEALRFLAVLLSNALVLGLAAGAVADRLHRRGMSLLVADPPLRRRRRLRGAWFDEFLDAACTASGRPLRLLVVKDLRIFRRDVAQWSQVLIFFGLLGLYFWNVRSFNYRHSYAAMIGFLNLAVVSLILSTFTTRFVFPSVSLEGRRFWILGLLPVDRDQIVWSKFLFAFVGGVVPCCGLVALSDVMLGLAPWIVAIHEVCCAGLCAALAGIAVGLGARIPDLRETSPAKIAAGFGGTLCLVTSSLVIIATVLATAVPVHLHLAAEDAGGAGFRQTAAVAGGVAVALAVTASATLVPLLLGLRAFRRLEP